MAQSPDQLFSELDKIMLKPQQNLLTDVRNSYVPQPINWASAVVPGTPGTAEQQRLNSRIANEEKKITNAGGVLPSWDSVKSGFMDVLDFLDRGRAAVVNPLADIASNGWSKANIGQDVWNGITGKQHSTVADILNNVPALKNDPNKLEWNDFVRNGLGFVGDVALDPLTYLTLGGSSLVKAGTKAALTTAESLAKNAGVQMTKNAFELPQAIHNATMAKYADNPAFNQDLIGRLATKRSDEAMQAIQGAAMQARSKAQNALFNFDVPFTNVTKQFGSKPDFLKIKDPTIGAIGAGGVSNLLRETGLQDHEIPQFLQSKYGVQDASQMTTQMLDHLQQGVNGIDPTMVRNIPDFFKTEISKQVPVPGVNTGKIFNLKSSQSTVNNLLDQAMTHGLSFNPPLQNGKHLAQWFADNFPQLGNKADFTQIPYKELRTWAEQVTPQLRLQKADEFLQSKGHSLNDLLNQADNPGKLTKSIGDIRAEEGLRKVAGAGTTLPRKMETQTTTHLTTKETQQPNILHDLEQQINPFVQDAGGKSSLDSLLSRKNPFNARTLGSTDELVNHAGELIRNTDNRIYGHMQQMDRDLHNVGRMMKGLTDAEKQAVLHTVENHFPGNMKAEDFMQGMNTEKINQVSEAMKQILDRIGRQGLDSGTLSELRNNYFPHVFKTSEEDKQVLQEIFSDPEMAKLLGRSKLDKASLSRTGFQTFAEMDNAVSKLREALQKATPEEAPKIEEAINRIENMFERDPLQALSTRYRNSIRANAMSDLFKQFKTAGLVRKDLFGPNVSHKDFHRLTAEEAGQLGIKKGEGQFIHKDVLEGMQKVHELFKDKGLQNFLDNVNGIQNIWKSLVTSVMPSHHFYNMIGNLANNAMAGVGIQRYSDAGKILRQLQAGKLTPKSEKVIQQAIDQGVLNQGSITDYVKSGIDFRKQTVGDKIAESIRNAPGAKQMQDVGNVADNFTRLALFLEGLSKTGSAKKAGDMVHKYLFNYRESTTADKAAKIAFPFWSWMKNNVPLQLEHLLTNPRYYATYGKIKQQFTGDENTTPDWAKDEYMKVPGTDNTFLNPRLPLQDLNKVDSPMSMILNSMTPLAKVPIEVEMNKQFFNGQPIDRNKDAGGSYDTGKLLEYLGRQLGGLSKVPGVASGSISPMELLIGKPQTFDPEKVKMDKLYERDQKLQHEIKRLKEQGKIVK